MQMKYLLHVLFSILFFFNQVLADETNTIFEGFDAKIVSIVDDMTDEESGVIFLYFGPIYMEIYGHNDYTIWADKNNLHFAVDGIHLIRVGENKPYSLKSLSKRNGLKPTSSEEAESVIT